MRLLTAVLALLISCGALAQNTVTTTAAANPAPNVSSGNISGIVAPANGGTGIANNAAATLTRSGSHALTLTTTGTTDVTLPTSGTLARISGETHTAPIVTGALSMTGDTWANIGGTTPTAGSVRYVTNIGAGGTFWRYGNSRWAPMNGRATLATLGNAVAGITNSEAVVFQALIPAGAWKVNDSIRIWVTQTKSGATDSGTIQVRVGTAGSTADTSVMSLLTMGATHRRSGSVFEIKLTSATTVTEVGSTTSTEGSYAGAVTTTTDADATIPDATANALYVSLTIVSSGTNDTVGATSGLIELITP